VEGTGDRGKHIAGIVTCETANVVAHATALDARVDALNACSSARQFAIGCLLLVRQYPTARWLLRGGTRYIRYYEGEKAEVLA
jgi:hypothetical protein